MVPGTRGCDLIIGNPPWVVLNGIYSLDYKLCLKRLASELGIMRGGKHATHLEVSTVFYHQCRDLYLRDGGIIFFVVTAAVLAGDQHAKFRQFRGFGDVFAWVFNQDVFRIHNICLGLRKITQAIHERVKVRVQSIVCQGVSPNFTFILEKTPHIYVPYNLPSIKEEQVLVKRLVPEEEIESLLPAGLSAYYTQFVNGAAIYPRNLLFVQIESIINNVATIRPDITLVQKPPWDFLPFDTTAVESESLFQVAKSTELVPFHLMATNTVFLPLTTQLDYISDDDLLPRARAHFAQMQVIFKCHAKRGASISDLWPLD